MTLSKQEGKLSNVRVSLMGGKDVNKTPLYQILHEKLGGKQNPTEIPITNFTDLEIIDWGSYYVQLHNVVHKSDDKMPGRTSGLVETNSGIFILTYDITNQSSFDEIEDIRAKHVELFSSPSQVILVGLNQHLHKHYRNVDKSKAKEYAELHHMAFFEVSTLTKHNIDALSEVVSKYVKQHHDRVKDNHLKETENYRKLLCTKIGLFKSKYPSNQDIQKIGDILLGAVNNNFDLKPENKTTINQHLWNLQFTRSSFFNSVVNVLAAIVKEFYYIRETLGFIKTTSHINKNSPYMFFGEKQDTQDFIKDIQTGIEKRP